MRQLSSNQSVDQPVVSKLVRQLAIRRSHVSNHSVGQRKECKAVRHKKILSLLIPLVDKYITFRSCQMYFKKAHISVGQQVVSCLVNHSVIRQLSN